MRTASRAWIAIAAAIGLSACAVPRHVAPTDETQAWLVLDRTLDVQLLVRWARVTVDGHYLASLPVGARQAHAVPAGRRVVAVDMWDVPGRCEIEVTLLPGQSIQMKVEPRRELLATSAPAVLAPNPAIGLLAMTLGSAVESGPKTCGGAFRIQVAGPDEQRQ